MILYDAEKLKSASRNAFFAALLVIGLISGYRWLVVPHNLYLYAAERREAVTEEVARKNEILGRTVTRKIKELEKLNGQFEQLKGEVLIPDSAETFTSNLQTLAKEAGCSVNALNVITEKSKSKRAAKVTRAQDASALLVKSMVLSVAGEYENIVQLIEKLQKHNGKVWVDSVRMKLLGDRSSQLGCDMTITIYSINKELGLNE